MNMLRVNRLTFNALKADLLLREQGVASSNLAAPTNEIKHLEGRVGKQGERRDATVMRCTPRRSWGFAVRGRASARLSALSSTTGRVADGLAAPTSAGARIVDTLKASPGGRIEGSSVRGLAALIGGRKSTVHAALSALPASGVVAKAGTALVLTAAAAWAARQRHRVCRVDSRAAQGMPWATLSFGGRDTIPPC